MTTSSANLLVIFYIAGWYFFSLSISIYNKWMFGGGLNFSFPLFVTSFHQVCLFFLSGGLLLFRPKLRPSVNISGNTASATVAGSSWEKFGTAMAMPLMAYVTSIVPCSVASAGDIGLSNVSLRYISLTLYTMLKTSSLAFVLLFGLLFRLERFSWHLVVIVGVMCGLVIMMTQKPDATVDQSQVLGVVLILGASFILGIRWCFTQLLLKKNDYTRNPVLTIFYISPAMALVLLGFALAVEKWSSFTALPIWELKGVAGTIGLMVVPGVFAFLMTLCEFQLLSMAPVLTLSIAGIFKELLTIMVSALVFGDKLSFVNAIGLVLTFAAVLWYNYYRYTEKDVVEENYTPLSDLEESLSGELKQH